ncbi:MAG TPA: tRNA preQ1(34) S-adenosylmethionine ribosyltransferase-isomerase QueA [Chthonomonadaceae bacterium]|nr:tRNA preQ1(34) S-adenosylmethionine ribosyltransferase-isomerase QueA [Chthonomonadaceae bacterium]
MRTDLFDYDLPPERIAQTPLPRGESRLLVLHRGEGRIEHRRFSDLPAYLRPGDTLVLNDTRVTARRLEARREGGLSAEVVLLHPVGDTCWAAIVRPGRALRPGKTLTLIGPNSQAPVTARVVATTPEGGRILDVGDPVARDALAGWGVAPLPPYINTPLPPEQEERYQTVYATYDGSAAAPTAGLHFTEEMLAAAEAMGVRQARLTLHVGIATFRPVRTEEIEAHEMHAETVSLPPEAAEIINTTTGRVIAVGTTCVRALETAGKFAEGSRLDAGNLPGPRVVPFAGETHLFISPGYHFRVVDAMITNFHLPRSTLLMLVSAFAGRETVLRAYQEAIAEGYRFFSFGDAMLIL